MSDAHIEMPRYRSHKEVSALQIGSDPIKQPDGTFLLMIQDYGYEPVAVDAAVVSRYMPGPGDYLVVYEDGYRSISPRKAFEDGYRRVLP